MSGPCNPLPLLLPFILSTGLPSTRREIPCGKKFLGKSQDLALPLIKPDVSPCQINPLSQRHTVLTNCQVLHYTVLLTETHNSRISGSSKTELVAWISRFQLFTQHNVWHQGGASSFGILKKDTNTQSCLTKFEKKIETAALDKPTLVDHSTLCRVLICGKICQHQDC